MTQLAKHEPLENSLSTGNPIAAMLTAIMDKGVTPESVGALERLTDLYMKVETANAKKAFADAKAAMQAEIPAITANKAVPNNDKTIRYVYAPYESIMREVSPLISKHGFSLSFSQEVEEGRLTAVCTLTHCQGHSEANRFSVRAGKGPPGSSDAQADGAASTYAKRFALCNCLNITIETDQDARAVGTSITPEQAKGLEDRVIRLSERTGKDEATAFLRFAEAESFQDIRTGRYSDCESALTRKERTMK